jgi:hypothetical protein
MFLYGCETWSLTLREQYRLRVFEKQHDEMHLHIQYKPTFKITNILRETFHSPKDNGAPAISEVIIYTIIFTRQTEL